MSGIFRPPVIVSGVVVCLTAACGRADVPRHHVTGGPDVVALDRSVSRKSGQAAWQAHITLVAKDPTSIRVETDYNVELPEAARSAVAICDAFVAAGNRPQLVKVYGVKTVTVRAGDGVSKTNIVRQPLAATEPAPFSTDGAAYRNRCGSLVT